MAERRMFAKSVVQSGRFMRLGTASRCLYFELGMAADDDGCVEAYPVMLMTRATESDLKQLVDKSFVVILNEDLVTYINDWNRNNCVRNDRYTPSRYQNLLAEKGINIRLVSPKKSVSGKPTVNQMDTDGKPTVNQMDTDGKPMVNQMDTDGIHRLGKVSLGKDSLVKENIKRKAIAFHPPTLEEVINYCAERGNNVDPQKFFDYYTAMNWKSSDGKAVKNWKGKLITWENKQSQRPTPQPDKPTNVLEALANFTLTEVKP